MGKIFESLEQFHDRNYYEIGTIKEIGYVQVLELCFKLYSSRDSSVHSTAGVAIRQIVTALFERVSAVSAKGDLVSEEGEGEEEEVGGPKKEKDLSREAGDAYLLFQVYRHVVHLILCKFD